MTRILLVLAVLIGTTAVGCIVEEQVDFNIDFETVSGQRLSCSGANITTLEITMFSRGFPDVAYERYNGVCLDGVIEIPTHPGTYTLEVLGINADGAVCYSDQRPYEVAVAETYTVNWTVAQSEDGLADGCVYP